MIDAILHWWTVREANAATTSMVTGLLRVADDWKYTRKHTGIFRYTASLASESLGVTLSWEEYQGVTCIDVTGMRVRGDGLDDALDQAIPHACTRRILKEVARIRRKLQREERERKADDARAAVAKWAVAHETALRKTETRKNLGYDPVPREATNKELLGNRLYPIRGYETAVGHFWMGERIDAYLPEPHLYRLADGSTVPAKEIAACFQQMPRIAPALSY